MNGQKLMDEFIEIMCNCFDNQNKEIPDRFFKIKRKFINNINIGYNFKKLKKYHKKYHKKYNKFN